MINADKPHLWKPDIAASVDMFNNWFMQFAPATYRETRIQTVAAVEEALAILDDLRSLTPAALRANPHIIATLRMCTAPPIARDRLIGLAHAPAGLVKAMELKGRLLQTIAAARLHEPLQSICSVISRLLDEDIFPWLAEGARPSETMRNRASTIVADRLTGSLSDPRIRNAQEQRQLATVEEFLIRLDYERRAPRSEHPLTEMERGTFTFRLNVPVRGQREKVLNIPIDAVIQPHRPRADGFPILNEAKSAGDFTNTNKRRKEEATKIRQLRDEYGAATQLTLLLCGYFDSGYLGYEAAEGLDWVWEHRLDDLLHLGIAP